MNIETQGLVGPHIGGSSSPTHPPGPGGSPLPGPMFPPKAKSKGLPIWKDYYKKRKTKVIKQEHQPNPGGLVRFHGALLPHDGGTTIDGNTIIHIETIPGMGKLPTPMNMVVEPPTPIIVLR